MNKITKSVIGLSLITSSLLAGDVIIELDPIIEEFVSSNRIIVKASILDKKGLDVVRTYFKAADAANYSFVSMNCVKSLCSATLPAPSVATKGLDYLVLVKNKANEVYKTQTFSASSIKLKGDMPKYQTAPTVENISVKTELAKAPKMVTGFSDSMTVDTIESTARYGLVAGLGSSGSAAAGAGVATGTTSAGTVAASSVAAMSTTAIVATSVAVAGGAAAAGGGGSSSSGAAVSSSSSSSSNYLQCNATQTSGGDEGGIFKVILGKSSGSTVFTFDMYSIKDRMTVSYEGVVIKDTGCVSSGNHTSLSYSGTSTSMEVKIYPNCDNTSGTGWEFSLSCPQ